MKTETLTLMLQLAGVLHIGLAAAGASMPRAVNLHHHVSGLPPFIRRLFYVYFTFIGLMLLGFGIITFVCAEALATAGPLATALSIFLTVFWTIRLVVAALVFDVRPYLTNWFYRAGYQATNVVFIYLVAVYSIAAWKGVTA